MMIASVMVERGKEGKEEVEAEAGVNGEARDIITSTVTEKEQVGEEVDLARNVNLLSLRLLLLLLLQVHRGRPLSAVIITTTTMIVIIIAADEGIIIVHHHLLHHLPSADAQKPRFPLNSTPLPNLLLLPP